MASPLEFFPSRTLTTYLGKMFAVRIVAVLLMLVLKPNGLFGEQLRKKV